MEVLDILDKRFEAGVVAGDSEGKGDSFSGEGSRGCKCCWRGILGGKANEIDVLNGK